MQRNMITAEEIATEYARPAWVQQCRFDIDALTAEQNAALTAEIERWKSCHLQVCEANGELRVEIAQLRAILTKHAVSHTTSLAN